jgi:hypothetical protein
VLGPGWNPLGSVRTEGCLDERNLLALVDAAGDLLVGDPAQVVDPRRVMRSPALCDEPLVEALERRLRDRGVEQPVEPRTAVIREAQERLGRGLPDSDVVGVTADPIGSGLEHHVGPFLAEHLGDALGQEPRWQLGDVTIGEPEPLMTVR